MAPARQPKRTPKPRDRKAEYAKRNAQARRWGFKSYWDQRQHGDWASFLRYIQPGDLVLLDAHPSKLTVKNGVWATVPKQVIPDNPKRKTKHFLMRNLTLKQLERMIAEELQRGGNLSPVPSLDQRRLLSGEPIVKKRRRK